MRGAQLTVLLILLSAPAWAQTAPPPASQASGPFEMPRELGILLPPAPPAPLDHAVSDDVVARVMSFDRNADGRVTADELAERMQDVVAQADADRDGALTPAEVRLWAKRPPAPVAVRGFQAGRYGFSDQSGESSRLHVEDVLADLKLGPNAAEALAVVRSFLNERTLNATTDLLDELRQLVAAEQLSAIPSSVRPGSQIRTAVFPELSGGPSILLVVDRTASVRVLLPPLQKDRGLAAVDRFNKHQSLEAADRNALLERLNDLLTDEQRDDFRAALERRPVSKVGSAERAGGAIAVDVVSAR